MQTDPAFFGEQGTSGICPVVSALFDALAHCDVPDEYKIGALRCATDFLVSATRLHKKLPPDILCIPLNGDRN